MQTTLMGIAVALILALVTALVGPYFVNWNNHRSAFEAEASRIVGLNVRVGGDIEVKLLPSPSVKLVDIEIGPAGSPSRLRARSLGIEFGLGPLLRGELRAVEMRLTAPQVSLGLNSLGQIDWPSMALAGETLSIDRLTVDDGRVILTDAVSGARLDLTQFQFTGTVRSLTGPFRGDGTFNADGTTYTYRLAAGRVSDEGTKVKLAIDDSERPVNAELDGLVSFERNTPRFNGSLKLLRPAGAVQASGRVIAQEPWLFTARVTATAQTALFEQVMFQYGPEERAAMLSGTAELKLGARPQLQGALSARQIDFDRLTATPATVRSPPLLAIRNAADLLGAALRPAIATNVTVSIDAVTLGGALVQNVGADLSADGHAWRLDKLEFRAPGFAHVKLSGRVDRSAAGIDFAGTLDVDANDPRALMAWLAGRGSVTPQFKPLRVRGDLAFSPDRIALDRVHASFDRSTIEGRLSYAWPDATRPARLEAELTAGELDLDAILQSGNAAVAGLGLEWPREVVLGLNIERAHVAGFDAQKVRAHLTFDAQGVAIERLSVANFGNAAINASGRVALTPHPGGSIAIAIDAGDLSGVSALLERFAPTLAGPIRRLAGKQNAAKLQLTIGLENTGVDKAVGRLAMAGQIGVFRFDTKAHVAGRPADFAWSALDAAAWPDTRIETTLQTGDGNALLALIGLEKFASPDARPGRLTFMATRPSRGEWQIENALNAGLVDTKAKGKLVVQDDKPVSITLEPISGTVGGSPLRGALAVQLLDAPRVSGQIEIDTLDLPVAAAIAFGMPGRSGEDRPIQWSSAPFIAISSELTGRIEVKAQRALLNGTLAAKQFSGVLTFGPSEIAIEDVNSELAGGRLDGRVAVTVGHDGLTMQARVAVSNADAGALFSVNGRPRVAGKLSVQTELTAVGLSPAALIGSIAGAGHLTLADAQLPGLNPRIFDAATRAADLGIRIDADRVRDFVASSLDTGTFPVSRADATLAIKNGRIRLSNVALRSGDTDLAVIAGLDLLAAELDAAMTLTGAPADGESLRPTVFVTLKGPLFKPARHIAADALASWLALRAAERQAKQLSAVEPPAAVATRPAPDVTSALPKPPAASPPEIDVRAVAPVEQVPPLPPAITVLPAPRPRPTTAAPEPPQPGTRPAPHKPAGPGPGKPLDLLGAQR